MKPLKKTKLTMAGGKLTLDVRWFDFSTLLPVSGIRALLQVAPFALF